MARRLAAAGMRVAIIERKLFGGTCVNTGCIPTKTMVASAYAAWMARRAAEFGVAIAGHLVSLASLFALFRAFHQPIGFGALVAGFAVGVLFWIVASAAGPS